APVGLQIADDHQTGPARLALATAVLHHPHEGLRRDHGSGDLHFGATARLGAIAEIGAFAGVGEDPLPALTSLPDAGFEPAVEVRCRAVGVVGDFSNGR